VEYQGESKDLNTNLIYMLKRGRGGGGGQAFMAGGVGPSSLFMASGEGHSLPFVSGGVGPCSLFVHGGVGPLLRFISSGVGPRSPLVHGGVGPLLLFVPDAVGPSLLFVCGGLGPSFAMHGAGGLLSFVDGAAGGLLSFMGGGAGGSSHCSWVVVVCLCLTISGWWWWCTLVGFMCCGMWPSSLSWWSCRHLRVRVVGGCSCLQALHPSSSIGVILHHFCVLSLRVILIACPHHRMFSSVCPHCVIVSCPPRRCPVLLSLLCPHCDVLFGCMKWHLC